MKENYENWTTFAVSTKTNVAYFFSETWCITVVVRMGRAKAAITATTTVLKRLRGSY